jgi:hypothetical protein
LVKGANVYTRKEKNNVAKISDRYYSGREVQRILSITEPALRNLVKQRKLRKIVPPGREYGVYLKEEVNTYAEKWLAFLTVKEPPKTIFTRATEQDMEEEQELARRAIGSPGLMTSEIRRAWLAVCPEGDYHLRHNNKLVAYFRILPVKHERLIEFMEGKIRGGEITADDIDPFEPGKPVECFLVGIASEPDVGELTRMHYVEHLIRGTLRELEELGRKGYIVTKIYATSDTPTGIAMAIHAGMEEYGQRIGKRLRFELDPEKSQSFLIDGYKKGLAEWKKEQRRSTSKATTGDSKAGGNSQTTEDVKRQTARNQ